MFRYFGTFLFSLLIQSVYCDKPTVRQTNNGPVEGLEKTNVFGNKYYAFKGIPYAESPITGVDSFGNYVDRRFKAPERINRKWQENLIVQNKTQYCTPSTNIFWNVTGIEDCLTLSVFVPEGGAEKKSVIVYIHGGAFTEGFADEDAIGPDLFLDADTVVVYIIYRVGVFGFLNLGFGDYTGNMGLKDQQLALRWIYENIENFSGNKDEILLFGISAGAASVDYHLHNEDSQKYFTRAVAMSGSILSYFAFDTMNHLQRMYKCANTNDKETLIEFLKTANADKIVECGYQKTFGNTLDANWVPTIEKPDAKIPFITQLPEDLLNLGKIIPKDVLYTLHVDEQIFFDPTILSSSEPIIKENLSSSGLKLPYRNFNENSHPNEYKQALDKLRVAYYSNATTVEQIRQANIDLMSDINFGYSVLNSVVLQTKINQQSKTTFFMRYGMHDAFNWFRLFASNHTTSTHSEELCYLFYCKRFAFYGNQLQERTGSAYNTATRINSILTNFIRTGNPSIDGEITFKSCTSPSDIVCEDILTYPVTQTTTNLMDQLHYNTWQEVDQIYKNRK